MRLFGEFTKVEELEDGTLRVEGIASSETPDSVGDIMKASAIKAAIPDYMKFGAVREMHGPSAAGTALALEVDEENLTRFEALVVDPTAVKKVQTGVYKGFSVGGKILKRNAKNKKVIEQIKLTEISLVDRPANPDATFSLAKFDTDEEANMAGTTETTPTLSETLAKWAGEEISDARVALDALGSIFYLLQKEGAAGEAEQATMLQQVTDKLRAFIASEIQERNPDNPGGDALAMGKGEGTEAGGGEPAPAAGSGEEPLAKKGAKFSKATKDALGKFKTAFEECMKALAIDDEGKDDEGTEKSEGAEALAKVAGLEESLAKAEGERDEALAKAEALTAEVEELKKGQEALIEETNALLDQFKAKGALRVVGKGEDLGTLAKAEGSGAKEPETARDAIVAAHRSGGTLVTGR